MEEPSPPTIVGLKSNRMAENAAAKFYKWDKRDGYWVPENRNLYNSYFYAVEDPTNTVLDKLKLHGDRFTKNLDGGVAAHINLAEHLTKTQYRTLMDIAAKEGCSYFTYNVAATCCNNPDCGYVSKHTLDACPICGSTDVDYATRIIGYLKKVSNFSEARQIEASKRFYDGGVKF